MSEAADPRSGLPAGQILIGLVVVLAVVALALLASQRQTSLRGAPVGFDGLAVWLTAGGLDAHSFTGGWPLLEEDVGLLVVPLFDTALDEGRTRPRTQEEFLLQQDEYDLGRIPLWGKAAAVPTLVVLPKWRTGMRLTEVAHPVLLAEAERIERLGTSLVRGGDLTLRRADMPFATYRGTGADGRILEATLYAAQTFEAPGCRSILGPPEATVLADCPLSGNAKGARAYILSDPDLLNNHGLVLGDNAVLARDLLGGIKRDGDVVIDYSRTNWLVRADEGPARARTWADLLRFFAPPFTLIWIGAALTFGLMLWRAGLRFGPALPGPVTGAAGQAMAVAARARLMRLSGRAGPLARQYLQARLAATASRLFGPGHAARLSTPEAFLDYARRRHPERAEALAAALDAVAALPDAATPHHAMAATQDLDDTLEHIIHDTRGTERPR